MRFAFSKFSKNAGMGNWCATNYWLFVHCHRTRRINKEQKNYLFISRKGNLLITSVHIGLKLDSMRPDLFMDANLCAPKVFPPNKLYILYYIDFWNKQVNCDFLLCPGPNTIAKLGPEESPVG